ncbi:hypothetical protein FGADI_3351 [Fusarium gaditjirri]|uniref:Chromo domain-containing protein n=1 Tax=Fusarium gaditjirri TaxID=282569 RepID=A0A8H4TG13_9HYPO|nr:hypothetical protein FGADI_3351 [Fusarium gaditjirri]
MQQNSNSNTLIATNTMQESSSSRNSNTPTTDPPKMASLSSYNGSWDFAPTPMDDVHRNFLILDHKVDTIGDKDGPFVVLLIRGSKSRKRWQGWVDEKFVHEKHEEKVLAYWTKAGGRDAHGIRESCPLRIHLPRVRKETEQGPIFLCQYVGYPDDDRFNQWEPEWRVEEVMWEVVPC